MARLARLARHAWPGVRLSALWPGKAGPQADQPPLQAGSCGANSTLRPSAVSFLSESTSCSSNVQLTLKTSTPGSRHQAAPRGQIGPFGEVPSRLSAASARATWRASLAGEARRRERVGWCVVRRAGPRQEEARSVSYVGSSDGSPSRAPLLPSRLALQVLVTCDPSERDVQATRAVAIANATGPVRVVLWADGGVPTVAQAPAKIRTVGARSTGPAR